MSLKEIALELHRKNKGKIEVVSKVALKTAEDLSIAYTPGVAEPCKEIHKDKESVYDYTAKGNMVAVVTNGTAVLGLGDIGPEAALPVMEGKALLFKNFGGVDAFPICVDTKDADKIVELVKLLEPTFGGINLEDIAAPDCFEIENKLKKELNIPVFHDDQHGTAIVAASGLINALKIVDKKLEEIIVVVNGAGAAGIAVTKLLLSLGIKEAILCDRNGAIYEGRQKGMNSAKTEIAKVTNRDKRTGTIGDVIVGADVVIGLSGPNTITPEMISAMDKPIVMAMANPVPEIMPEEASAAGAVVVCTGRSDFPNQINNVLVFPGVFRGALDVRAKDINEDMKVAAAYAVASLITDKELKPEYVIPSAFDARVAPAVAKAVAAAAIKSGVARLEIDPEVVEENTRQLLKK
ncbi:MAG: malic enzyme-like NAD(P)-binding protein [Bacillota bacterium]